MKCPVQAFVAFALFIGGCATKPEAPQTARVTRSHFDQMNGASGKPEEMLLRVGLKNIGYVQFCDTDSTLRDGGTSKHLGCGDGRIECAKSLRILKEGGFRGWMMVDEWEVPDPCDACIKCKSAFDQAWP